MTGFGGCLATNNDKGNSRSFTALLDDNFFIGIKFIGIEFVVISVSLSKEELQAELDLA